MEKPGPERENRFLTFSRSVSPRFEELLGDVVHETLTNRASASTGRLFLFTVTFSPAMSMAMAAIIRLASSGKRWR